jgi:ribonuclease BN (tRNA processing enzyme)
VTAATVIHPGQTLGYRISDGQSTIAYLPDHEPALGADGIPDSPDWTSGHDLAADADLVLHDAQYTADEYEQRVGWGHSRVTDAVDLARQARARRLVTFHHDPAHDDATLDAMLATAQARAGDALEVVPGREGETFRL